MFSVLQVKEFCEDVGFCSEVILVVVFLFLRTCVFHVFPIFLRVDHAMAKNASSLRSWYLEVQDT